jgi:hypothetical protein
MLCSVSRCSFVLVDQVTQNRSTRDPFIAEVCPGMGRLRWAKVAGAVGSSTVAVPNILGDHHMHVPLTEDQHSIGEFGSEGADEPFGDTGRSRTARRNLDHVESPVGEDSIEGRSELTSPISEEKPELSDAITKIHHQSAGLLRSPPAVWVCGRAQ